MLNGEWRFSFTIEHSTFNIQHSSVPTPDPRPATPDEPAAILSFPRCIDDVCVRVPPVDPLRMKVGKAGALQPVANAVGGIDEEAFANGQVKDRVGDRFLH